MELCNAATEINPVCVIDDDDSFRTGLVRALNASAVPVVSYRCAGEYLLAEWTNAPACIVLDMWMPGPSGMELLHALSARDIAPPVIFVTACSEVPASVQAMKCGAVDFLLKPIALSCLLRSIRKAIDIDGRRRAVRAAVHEAQTHYATLSEHERKVFAGVVEGKLNKQLAVRINTCERTIKTYRASMMRKMRAASLVDLVRAAQLLERSQAPALRMKTSLLPELRTVVQRAPLQHGA